MKNNDNSLEKDRIIDSIVIYNESLSDKKEEELPFIEDLFLQLDNITKQHLSNCVVDFNKKMLKKPHTLYIAHFKSN